MAESWRSSSDDKYGFSARGLGYWDGSTYEQKLDGVSVANFWSFTEYNTYYAYFFRIADNSRGASWYEKVPEGLLSDGRMTDGFSVRCIKD